MNDVIIWHVLNDQLCWLYSEKYTENHYLKGKCNGLQFFKPKNEEDIKNTLLNNNNNIYNLYIYKNNNINYINTIYIEEFIGDLIHPNNKKKKELVSFYNAYKECSLCEYIFWIFMFFTTSILQYGVLIHNNISNIQDPAFSDLYSRNNKKVYINRKLDNFLIWSYIVFQFLFYFFFNISVMIILFYSFNIKLELFFWS